MLSPSKDRGCRNHSNYEERTPPTVVQGGVPCGCCFGYRASGFGIASVHLWYHPPHAKTARVVPPPPPRSAIGEIRAVLDRATATRRHISITQARLKPPPPAVGVVSDIGLRECVSSFMVSPTTRQDRAGPPPPPSSAIRAVRALLDWATATRRHYPIAQARDSQSTTFFFITLKPRVE